MVFLAVSGGVLEAEIHCSSDIPWHYRCVPGNFIKLRGSQGRSRGFNERSSGFQDISGVFQGCSKSLRGFYWNFRGVPNGSAILRSAPRVFPPWKTFSGGLRSVSGVF